MGIHITGQEFIIGDLNLNDELRCSRVMKNLRHVVDNIYILDDVIVFDIDARPAVKGEAGLRGGDTIKFSSLNHEEATEQPEDELLEGQDIPGGTITDTEWVPCDCKRPSCLCITLIDPVDTTCAECKKSLCEKEKNDDSDTPMRREEK